MFEYELVKELTKVVGMARRSTDEEKQQKSIDDQVDQ
jgi:hypothetical protein